MSTSGRTHARAHLVRTCVGCRERAAKSDLLRVVVVEEGDACVPDLRGTLPGRGAYVHPRIVCLDLAQRRRAFARALRVRVGLDIEAVRRAVETAEADAAQARP
ncbi:YlxR family protein [Streptomyces sp. NPDC058045]|uniref:YlxR family protein n=1 Tax=Streptomyces sp. NPDC058045 TaxID=3346311 RepID=UPI0036E28D26